VHRLRKLSGSKSARAPPLQHRRPSASFMPDLVAQMPRNLKFNNSRTSEFVNDVAERYDVLALKRDNLQLLRENNTLKSEMGIMKKTTKVFSVTDVEEMDKSNHKMRTFVEALGGVTRQLRENDKEHTQTIKMQADTLSEVSHKFAALSKKLADVTATRDKLQETNQDVSVKLHLAQRQLESREEESVRLQALIMRQEKDMSELRYKCDAMATDERNRHTLDLRMSFELKQMTHQKESLEKKLKSYESRVHQMRAEAKKSQNLVKKLREEIDTVKASAAAQLRMLSSKTAALKRAEEQAFFAREKCDDVMATFHKTKQKMDALQNKVRKSASAVSINEQIIHGLQAELREAARKHEAAEGNLEAVNATLQEVEAALESVRLEWSMLQSDYDKLRAVSAEQQASLNDANEELYELQSEVNQKDVDISELQEKFALQDQALEKEKALRDLLSGQLVLEKRIKEEKEAQITKMEGAHMAQVMALQQEISTERENVQRLRRELEGTMAYRREMDSAVERMSKRMAEGEDQLQQAYQDVNSLTRRLDAMREIHEYSKEEQEKKSELLTSELKELKSNFEVTTVTENHLQEVCREYKRVDAELRAKITALERFNEEHLLELSKVRESELMYKTENARIQLQLSELIAEKTDRRGGGDDA
jgi:chromosome segregation ATPase